MAIAVPILALAPSPGAQAAGETTPAPGAPAAPVAPALNLVPMDRIQVPIVDADRIGGTLRVKLVLETKDEDAAKRLARAMPMLRSAGVAASLEFARLDASALRAVDVATLDQILTDAMRKVSPDLDRVLIVEVAAART